MSRLLNEPVLLGSAIRAVIIVLITFGINITSEQIAAVMGALEIILTLVTRTLVTPNQLAEHRVDMGGRPTVPLNK